MISIGNVFLSEDPEEEQGYWGFIADLEFAKLQHKIDQPPLLDVLKVDAPYRHLLTADTVFADSKVEVSKPGSEMTVWELIRHERNVI